MSAKKPTPTIYEQAVRVTHVYLGPAADRFISRQVENHLHKAPNDLTQEDLLSLIDWIHSVVALLTDDEDIVSEYINELKKLASNHKGKKRGKK